MKDILYTIIERKDLPNSEKELLVTVPHESIALFRPQALQRFNESLDLPGFRKGHIPENILIGNVGELRILEESLERALPEIYEKILADEKIDAIGRPEIKITKIAPGNPVEFRIKTALMPTVKLPDYKMIAKRENAEPLPKQTVEEKEIDDVILAVRKSRVDHSHHDHEKLSPEEHEKEIVKNLPEWNDDFVKTIGDFKSIADFKEKVRENITRDKEHRAIEKRRIAIAEKIIAGSTYSLPTIVIDGELHKMENEFLHDVEHMGLSKDDYLKHSGKTIEDLRKEWRPDAEKKAALQLILNTIATKEKIVPDEILIKKEMESLMQMYKEVDPVRARIYTETVMTNNDVFKFLETL